MKRKCDNVFISGYRVGSSLHSFDILYAGRLCNAGNRLHQSKNAGNIIMKNLMDYCIGSVLFWVIGFSFLYGDSIGGFIGTPSLFAAGKFAAAGDLPKRVFLMFATVFCSTATTIVSGAMAGRTKFKAYLTYSAVMSGIVYPITGHWIWNSAGWLKSIGFHDFAGGTAVHVVGGTTALYRCAALWEQG